MHVFYLHGFASSSQSGKAVYLEAKLRERGIPLHVPDLNAPDFPTLTVTRMVTQVIAAIEALPPAPVMLIGSSLGAFVAVQVAVRQAGSRTHPIARLVLLAPALDLSARADQLGDRGVAEWESTGQLNVFHYAYGRMMPLHYGFYADARTYDSAGATLTMPIQVFQGRRDTAVDPAAVERWASTRPNVELHMLDDDHQLGASLDYIWQRLPIEG